VPSDVYQRLCGAARLILLNAIAISVATAHTDILEKPSRFEWFSPEYRNSEYPLIRLLTLLVNGQSLIGSKVMVVGVLSLEFEDTRLYLTKDSYTYHNIGNAIYLSLTPEQVAASKAMQGQYVEVSGTVVADRAAAIGGSVRLEQVKRVALGGPLLPRE
jgi:hypothetical protein